MRYTDDLACHRIEGLIENFLPSKCHEFKAVLSLTKAQIMGSFPLHSLAATTARWPMPGDMDIFLCPTTRSLMNRSVQVFSEFLKDCGYIRVRFENPLRDPLREPRFSQDPHQRMIGFHVISFVKQVPPSFGRGSHMIQLIIHHGIDSNPEWNLRVMDGFDLSCCAVAYDGQSFFVSADNLHPTTQPVIIRHNHATTMTRVAKYLRRGFAFVLRTGIGSVRLR